MKNEFNKDCPQLRWLHFLFRPKGRGKLYTQINCFPRHQWHWIHNLKSEHFSSSVTGGKAHPNWSSYCILQLVRTQKTAVVMSQALPALLACELHFYAQGTTVKLWKTTRAEMEHKRKKQIFVFEHWPTGQGWGLVVCVAVTTLHFYFFFCWLPWWCIRNRVVEDDRLEQKGDADSRHDVNSNHI